MLSYSTDVSSLAEQLAALSTTEPATYHQKLEWGPIEHLAYYSCDESDKVTFDLACLHKFRQPSSLPADLTRGRDLFHERNKHNRTVGHPTSLDGLTRACVALGRGDELGSADVVTKRGLLVKMMLGDPLDLKFYDVDGTLYLMGFDQSPNVIYDNQLIEGYHGYAFEALCTQPENTLVGVNDTPIPTLDVWKCIVRRTFGDLNVVFDAEVDCVEGDYENTSDNLIELKTEKISSSYYPSYNDEKKRKKWYLQSYLIGIPAIFIGYRDRQFTLRKVDRVPLEQVYRPPSGDFDEEHEWAYEILRELRAFCRGGKCKSGAVNGASKRSSAWRVTVERGVLVGQPQMTRI